LCLSVAPGSLGFVLLQASQFCNLNCDYCYIPATERTQYKFMALEDVKTIFKKIFTSSFLSPDGLTILWHAGEPLAAPISYYEDIIGCLTDLKNELLGISYELSFDMQTNGTLLNDAWIDFIKKHRIGIGISCDGPQFLHDRNRRFWKGQGTFEQVLTGIQLLKENNIDFGALAVITPETLAHPDEFIQFFIDMKIPHLGLLPQTPALPGQNMSISKQEFYEKSLSFVRRIVQILEHSSYKVGIRELDIVARELFQQSHEYFIETEPFTSISIDINGNFSTFSPDLLGAPSKKYNNFIIGNLLQDTLESAAQTELFKTIYQDIQRGVDVCRSECDYFSICRQHTPSDKYAEHVAFNVSETYACIFSQKVITDVLLDKCGV
jgi:uncharacterized protein